MEPYLIAGRLIAAAIASLLLVSTSFASDAVVRGIDPGNPPPQGYPDKVTFEQVFKQNKLRLVHISVHRPGFFEHVVKGPVVHVETASYKIDMSQKRASEKLYQLIQKVEQELADNILGQMKTGDPPTHIGMPVKSVQSLKNTRLGTHFVVVTYSCAIGWVTFNKGL